MSRSFTFGELTMIQYRCANCGYEMQSGEALSEGAVLCPKCQAKTMVELPAGAKPAPPMARIDPDPSPDAGLAVPVAKEVVSEDPLGDVVKASRAALSRAIAPKPRAAGGRGGARPMTRPAAGVRPMTGVRGMGVKGATAPYAVAALTAGIISLACILGFVTFPMAGIIGILAGPAAVILALSSKGMIQRNPSRYTGDGMATAGLVLGIIGLALGILAVLQQVMGTVIHR
jgi:DNA-directed RNA polymerase subunit RPC12/RpoP